MMALDDGEKALTNKKCLLDIVSLKDGAELRIGVIIK